MENHVLLWRKRPADWLTAGAQRASCTSNRETGRGRREGSSEEEKKTKQKKKPIRKQRGEGFTSHPDKFSHFRFHILPLSGSFTVSPPSSLTPTAVPCSPRSPLTPMELHRMVHSMTTNTGLAISADALRGMEGHGRAHVARSFDKWLCHV